MAGVGEAASIIAVIQVTAEIGKFCSRYLSDAHNAAQDISRVLQKISDLQVVLCRLQEMPLKDIDTSRINQCHEDIKILQNKIDLRLRDRVEERIGLRLRWPLKKVGVENEIKILEGHLKFFDMITNLDIRDKVVKIANRVDDTERNRLLNELAFIGDAFFENDRRPQCLENTRVDVLQEINTWASNRSPQPIFWLKGMAGTGKSTIALTTADNLSKTSSCIMASYFFKRGGGELASSRKLLPTLIHQMAKSPPFYDSLLVAIRENQGPGQSMSIKNQFDKLLIGPLRNLEAPEHDFVWVIDALDECDQISDIELFLRLIAQTPDIKNLPLRVFVTSRPEISIQDSFGAMPQSLHHDLTLNEVSRDVVDADITNFFNHELARIRESRRLPDHWPDPQKQLQTVCKITSGNCWDAIVWFYILIGLAYNLWALLILVKNMGTGHLIIVS